MARQKFCDEDGQRTSRGGKSSGVGPTRSWPGRGDARSPAPAELQRAVVGLERLDLADDKAYVQPLLSSLSSQLDAERRRREDAEQQVALLSAQVARREAELEARLDPRHDGRSDGAMNMTREAALGVLELTIARNRALEADVKVLEAKLKASRVYPAESPPPRPSSSRPTLVGSPQKRKALAPDRVRSAPPISPARSIRELVPPLGPRPTFLSPRRPSRPRSSPSPPSTPRSPPASTPSPVRTPNQPPARTPSPSPARASSPLRPPRTPPAPAVVALDTHLHALEDGMAELHRERDRLAVVPSQPAPFDHARFARVGLLEAECVRLRRRVRELEARQPKPDDERKVDDAVEEDLDVTIRAAPPHTQAPAPPPPAPLLPPIDLRPAPTTRPSELLHWSPARPHRSPTTPPGPPRTQSADAQEQRLAQLAAELARAQDGVAERERAMKELRAEIARLRGD